MGFWDMLKKTGEVAKEFGRTAGDVAKVAGEATLDALSDPKTMQAVLAATSVSLAIYTSIRAKQYEEELYNLSQQYKKEQELYAKETAKNIITAIESLIDQYATSDNEKKRI